MFVCTLYIHNLHNIHTLHLICEKYAKVITKIHICVSRVSQHVQIKPTQYTYMTFHMLRNMHKLLSSCMFYIYVCTNDLHNINK